MTDPDATERNRGVIAEFARLMYDERRPADAFERFVAPDYVQHNPALPDGSAAAVAFLTPLYTAEGSTFEVQRILVDGDLAAIHVRAHPAGRPVLAVADLYRLEDGRIVEHWDAIQPVPEQSANDHPMF
ncbi:nuclear transport factor 2 family protein [uncultured Amnibacterium sp.]|uniref:nuclear transport factor 2 family protein n=1 Tax=uncultured Amnibacterium sp. TaxID=1631851 RepID=UPI0035CC967A